MTHHDDDLVLGQRVFLHLLPDGATDLLHRLLVLNHLLQLGLQAFLQVLVRLAPLHTKHAHFQHTVPFKCTTVAPSSISFKTLRYHLGKVK